MRASLVSGHEAGVVLRQERVDAFDGDVRAEAIRARDLGLVHDGKATGTKLFKQLISTEFRHSSRAVLPASRAPHPVT